MSAVIAIMNKNGVALAADSAVTISGGGERKIYPNANKIFTISKFHPVGVMIYNSASFMDTPWEVLIKIYRKQLKDKCFDTVNDYYLDFISFLKDRKFFSGEDEQREILSRNLHQLLIKFVQETFSNEEELLHAPEVNEVALNNLFKEKIESTVDFLKSGYNKCEEFQDYEKTEFDSYSNDLINESIKDIFEENLNLKLESENKRLISELLYEHFTRSYYYFGFSGLVFVGFGEDEIYPHLIPVHISSAFDNRLRYHVEEKEVAYISDKDHKSVNICAFAQTDVINTVLYGIDPDFKKLQEGIFEKFIKLYQSHIVNLVEEAPSELKEQIKGYDIESIVSEMKKATFEVQIQKFFRPLYQAVSSLAKEDLGEMAESLIKLTYLKRRMMFHEESVGGPVDVAIITKGDGFIWEKRKHYFKPELNPTFFQNYLKY